MNTEHPKGVHTGLRSEIDPNSELPGFTPKSLRRYFAGIVPLDIYDHRLLPLTREQLWVDYPNVHMTDRALEVLTHSFYRETPQNPLLERDIKIQDENIDTWISQFSRPGSIGIIVRNGVASALGIRNPSKNTDEIIRAFQAMKSSPGDTLGTTPERPKKTDFTAIPVQQLFDTIDATVRSARSYTREQLIRMDGTDPIKDECTKNIHLQLNSMARILNPSLPPDKNFFDWGDSMRLYLSYAADFVPPKTPDVTPLSQIIKGINYGTWLLAKPETIPWDVQAFIKSQVGPSPREMRAFLRDHATKYGTRREPLPLPDIEYRLTLPRDTEIPEPERPMPETMPDMSQVGAFFHTVKVTKDNYRYFDRSFIENNFRYDAEKAGIHLPDDVAMHAEWLFYVHTYPETAEYYLHSIDSDDPKRRLRLDRDIRTAFKLPQGDIPPTFMSQFRGWLENFIDKEEEVIVIPPSPIQALEPSGQPLARIDHEQTAQDLLEKARVRMETEADLRMDAILDGLAMFDDISGFASLSPELQPDTNVFTGKSRIGLTHIYRHYTSAEAVLGATHPKVEQIGLRLAADGMDHLKHLDYDDVYDDSIMAISMEVLLQYESQPEVLDEFVNILSDPKFRDRSKKYINTVQMVKMVREGQFDQAAEHLQTIKTGYKDFLKYLGQDQVHGLLSRALEHPGFARDGQILNFLSRNNAALEFATRKILETGVLHQSTDNTDVLPGNLRELLIRLPGEMLQRLSNEFHLTELYCRSFPRKNTPLAWTLAVTQYIHGDADGDRDVFATYYNGDPGNIRLEEFSHRGQEELFVGLLQAIKEISPNKLEEHISDFVFRHSFTNYDIDLPVYAAYSMLGDDPERLAKVLEEIQSSAMIKVRREDYLKYNALRRKVLALYSADPEKIAHLDRDGISSTTINRLSKVKNLPVATIFTLLNTEENKGKYWSAVNALRDITTEKKPTDRDPLAISARAFFTDAFSNGIPELEIAPYDPKMYADMARLGVAPLPEVTDDPNHDVLRDLDAAFKSGANSGKKAADEPPEHPAPGDDESQKPTDTSQTREDQTKNSYKSIQERKYFTVIADHLDDSAPKFILSSVIDALRALGFSKPPQSLKEVKKAYRKLAREYHPDTGTIKDDTKMKELSSAMAAAQIFYDSLQHRRQWWE